MSFVKARHAMKTDRAMAGNRRGSMTCYTPASCEFDALFNVDAREMFVAEAMLPVAAHGASMLSR